jgi:hypothetical protein
VGKLLDVVGLYVDRPAHAAMRSVDEKSQIQALDRTETALPRQVPFGVSKSDTREPSGCCLRPWIIRLSPPNRKQ